MKYCQDFHRFPQETYETVSNACAVKAIVVPKRLICWDWLASSVFTADMISKSICKVKLLIQTAIFVYFFCAQYNYHNARHKSRFMETANRETFFCLEKVSHFSKLMAVALKKITFHLIQTVTSSFYCIRSFLRIFYKNFGKICWHFAWKKLFWKNFNNKLQCLSFPVNCTKFMMSSMKVIW